eukprot:NODE_3_length_80033_cov_0.932970.p10 type:complete len:544 gc:universal NODE_3_length_80033_cov_0.932970:69234-70865(+)
MKPLELNALRRSVYQISNKTTTSAISRILEALTRSKYDLVDRTQLAEITATKRPNTSTINCFLHLSAKSGNFSRPFRLYEETKNLISLETLREFAIFAQKVNDPIYVSEVIETSKKLVVDPLKVKNNIGAAFKYIIAGKSILICLFFNLHFLPTLILLAANTAMLYFIRPAQRETLKAITNLETKYFFHPFNTWTTDMITNYIITLRAAEQVRNDRIEDFESKSRISTLINSKTIHDKFKSKQFESVIDSYIGNEKTTPSAVASVMNSYFETGKPLEALKLYEENRANIFNTHINRKRFVLNNLIKSLGFSGFPQYAEFVLLSEFHRLNVKPTSRSLIKVVQSLQNCDDSYSRFWHNLKNSTSVDSIYISEIFGISYHDIMNIIKNRCDLIETLPGSYKSEIVDPLRVAFAYFRQLEKFDAISVGVFMTSCIMSKQHYATVRLFSMFHQITEIDSSELYFLDPFSGNRINLDMSIFEPPQFSFFDEMLLFGKSSIINRTRFYPPSERMMKVARNALSALGLASDDINTQFRIRSANLISLDLH